MNRTWLFGLLLLSYVLFYVPVRADEVWLIIDTKKSTLEVKRGLDTLMTMNNIAIGRNGAGFKQHMGDDVTPIGTYRIGWVNKKSPFHRFYGFDYPSVENANEALLSGLLSKEKHTAIINAHKKQQVPPQDTKIGGNIGIHGLGSADKSIHQAINWTHGCIALTNEQVETLDRWIKKGTQVKIK
ncbi:MAG: L,D-transpeptidase family protein [Methylomarinum sp.]|nr:L,D-transpeptidase family protein [Methylomarinum sp.]